MLSQLLVRSNAAVIGPATPEINEAERLLRAAGMQIVYARAKGDLPPVTQNRAYTRALKFNRVPPLSKRSRVTDLPHLPGTLWVGCQPRAGKGAVKDGMLIETPPVTPDTWLENDLMEVISYLAVENKLPGWPTRSCVQRIEGEAQRWVDVEVLRPVIGQVSYNDEHSCWEVGVRVGWKKLPAWIIGRCANRFPREAYAGDLQGLTPEAFARFRSGEEAYRRHKDADKEFDALRLARETVLCAPMLDLGGVRVADFREEFQVHDRFVFGTVENIYEGALWAQRAFLHVYQDAKGWWMELGGCEPDSPALREFTLWAKESGKTAEGDLSRGWCRYPIEVIVPELPPEPEEPAVEEVIEERKLPEVSAAPPPHPEEDPLTADNVEERIAAQTAREVARLTAKPFAELTKEDAVYLLIHEERQEEPDEDRIEQLEIRAIGVSGRQVAAYYAHLRAGGEEDKGMYDRACHFMDGNTDAVDLEVLEARLDGAKATKSPLVRSLASKLGAARKRLGLMK